MSLGLILVGAMLLGMCAVSLRLLNRTDNQRLLAARLAWVRNGGTAQTKTLHPQHTLVAILTNFGALISKTGILSAKSRVDLRRTLDSAGFTSSATLSLFIGVKVALLIGCPLLAWLSLRHADVKPSTFYLAVGAAAVGGVLSPDMTIKRLRARALSCLEAGLPDALDMLVICGEAGLGLEPAIERVAEELAEVHPQVSREFSLTAHELRIATDRRRALGNLGARTELASLRRLGVTLLQTMQYGTPLSQALRTLATEMRAEALTRVEARAARLPVLLTLPMIAFILPTLFMVVGGPAYIVISHSLMK